MVESEKAQDEVSLVLPAPDVELPVDLDLPGKDDLAQSLMALSHLSADEHSLKDLLTSVATMAVKAIPGADGAGLAIIEPGRAKLIVQTAPFVEAADGIQFGINEGPAVSAIAAKAVMRSGSLGGDSRWPHYGPRVGRLGVHSVLALPLMHPSGGVVGAMNVYAHSKDAFDTRAEEVGELFALPAAISAHNAKILANAERLAANLQNALRSRPIIDQAIGILRSRHGNSGDEAFKQLRQTSQTTHVKLEEVADRVVTEAVKRARIRKASS